MTKGAQGILTLPSSCSSRCRPEHSSGTRATGNAALAPERVLMRGGQRVAIYDSIVETLKGKRGSLVSALESSTSTPGTDTTSAPALEGRARHRPVRELPEAAARRCVPRSRPMDPSRRALPHPTLKTLYRRAVRLRQPPGSPPSAAHSSLPRGHHHVPLCTLIVRLILEAGALRRSRRSEPGG